MKSCTIAFLALVSCASLAAQSNTAPSSGMKFSMVSPSDPALVPMRKAGEFAIEYVANKFMFEINKELSTKAPEEIIGSVHLKSMTLPGPEPGAPVITNVKLTSLKVRNPANAPDEADLDVLDTIRRDLENGRAPARLIVQRIDNGSGHPDEWRFYKPIATMQGCLACHGDEDTVSTAVREKLNQLYPHDDASDYQARQWRGVIRVSLAPPPAPKS